MQIMDIHLSAKAAVDDALARALAVAGLAAVALIHAVQLPDAFGEIGYLGALFIAAVAGSVLVATALTRTSDDRIWMAAGGLAGLILIGYILSRSVGLPGFTSDMGEWSEPRGLAAMVAESTLVVLSAGVLVGRRQAAAVPGEQRPAAARAGSVTEHPAW